MQVYSGVLHQEHIQALRYRNPGENVIQPVEYDKSTFSCKTSTFEKLKN